MNENICRFCMEIAYQGIFERDIFKKIISYVDPKIYLGDGLPTNICGACEKKIYDFHVFKVKCSEVANILRTTPRFSSSPCNNDDLDIQEFVNIDFLEKYDCTHSQLNDDNTKRADVPIGKIDIEVKLENDLPREIPKISYTIQCEVCGQICKSLATLKQHMNCHNDIKPFSCNICSKNFTRKFHKEIHMRSHSGEKPFVCNTCGKATGRKQDLIRHMRIHSDERNYACLKCDRRFKRSWDVHVHMRSHTGDKPYACDSCMKRYSTFSAFQKHLRSSAHIQ